MKEVSLVRLLLLSRKYVFFPFYYIQPYTRRQLLRAVARSPQKQPRGQQDQESHSFVGINPPQVVGINPFWEVDTPEGPPPRAPITDRPTLECLHDLLYKLQ